MKKILFVLIICCTTHLRAADTKISDYVIGQSHIINSDALNEAVTLEIYQPPTEKKNLPILFLLDSQHHFPHAIAVQQFTSEYNQSPEFMVVGIRTTDDSRSRWFYTQKEEFLAFFKSELIPYLEKGFPVGQERLLFGWEFAGSLIISTMTTDSELFNGYITASPTPIYGRYFPHAKADFDAFKQQLKSGRLKNTFFYFSQSMHDFPVQYGLENLLKLKNNYPQHLQWSYRQWQHVTHSGTGFPTLLDGIKSYYHNYPYLRASEVGLEKFLQKGGIGHIAPYYTSRKIRFGFTQEETDKAVKITHLSLVLQAVSENNYAAFEDFMQTFYASPEALENEHPNQLFNISMFYLQHGKSEKSLNLLNLLVKKYPDSPRPINGIGDNYWSLGDQKKARKYYQQAVKMARDNQHWRLSEFEMDLQKLSN
ncbi:alpha/beta hydrolase-fold protein [Marinicella sp. W31]|uniref:alpha/beta hydrolase-fold protein n=1 Tax=Marinicella sp. W31 TaxID=3023713 RepID=UPI00375694BA